MSIAYLNGQFLPLDEARISPMDRGFLFADSIYEVIPAFRGVPFRLTEHLARLHASLRAIQLEPPLSEADWKELIQELIERNGGGHQSLYLQVTRGTAPVRDHLFPDDHTPATVFALSSPLPVPAADSLDQVEGIPVITVADLRWQRCDIKSTALLANVLMREQARQAGAAEAVMLRDGYVTEGTASNLFLVQDGMVLTPPCGPWILPGITRDLVLELCARHGQPCREVPMNEATLRSADEIWITSSTRDLRPVVSLDRRPVGNGSPGPVWRRVAQWFLDYKRSLCGLS